MLAKEFDHVDAWVFDLDHTLYPPESQLFDQINIRMTDYVMRALNVDEAEANRLRLVYWRDFGTTLTGLMDLHGVDPGPYLHEVHQIDFSVLERAPELAALIGVLPGRKIVYTNGTAPYAEEVLAARGLTNVFDAVYGVEHAGLRPKPEARAFQTVFDRDGLTPSRAAMFEDDPRNLAVPHGLGMRTVHVAPEAEQAAHIEFHTDDLTGFLGSLVGR